MKIISISMCAMLLLACAAACHAQGTDVPTAITIAPDNFVYVTGASMNASGKMEYRTLAYDPSGTLLGARSYPTIANGAGIPTAIAVSGDTIIVTGVHPETTTGYDILTLAYTKTSLTPVQPVDNAPLVFRLEQSYPNPVALQSEAIITYTLPVAGAVRLYLTDVSGREVAELVSAWKEAGTFSTRFLPGALPPGTYYYVLQSSSLSEAKKLAVVGAR